MADDHHHRTMRVYLLGHAEEADAVIGDQICEIVLKKKSHGEIIRRYKAKIRSRKD